MYIPTSFIFSVFIFILIFFAWAIKIMFRYESKLTETESMIKEADESIDRHIRLAITRRDEMAGYKARIKKLESIIIENKKNRNIS